MRLFIEVLTEITILVTIVALLERKAWWIRVFDFPRLQIIILQGVCFAALLIFIQDFHWGHYLLAGALIASLAIQVSYTYPYFPIARKALEDCQSEKAERISFMVSNVQQKNNQYKKVLKCVKDVQPDVFLAVETNQEWKAWLEELDSVYPYSVKHPQENTYGMLLFSKFPFENAQVEYLVKDDIPSIHAEIRHGDFKFKLVCLHPQPPGPDKAQRTKPRDRELMVMARKIKANPAPYVVMGDLNDVAWSDTSYKFEKLSRLNDPRKGRGFYNSFHAGNPLFRWSLDHFFLSGDFRIYSIKRLKSVGSDHFPVFIECCHQES